jgi:NAD(P)-dependent dehydrogenase (short-subunit alcohol dehydrogenase family)
MAHYLITGASRGIGRELATQLQARGERVTATVRREADGEPLTALGVQVRLLDVADPESLERFAGELGDEPVDVLINNAGIYGNRADFADLDWNDVQRVFEVNAFGPQRVTQALLPNLRAGELKKVAHLTSRMGSIEDNSSGGSYAYRASKAALNMFAKSFAVDFASEGIASCVLHPGWVQTDMGGASAPVAVADSAAGLIARVDELTVERSGKFFNFDGEELPW